MIFFAAVAAAVALPSGWMAVPSPNQTAAQCAPSSSRWWTVDVQGNVLRIAPAPKVVRDGLPFALPVPPGAISAAGDIGDRHVLRVADGWLAGFDDGAQQGSLWWFGSSGSRADKLFGYDGAAWNATNPAVQTSDSSVVGGGDVPVYPAIGNVRAIAKVRDGIIALTGSSDPSQSSSGEGGALQVTRSGDVWHVLPLAILDGAPRAYAVDASGMLLVATDNGISRLSVKKSITTLTAFEHFSLGVRSLAIGPGGSLFVGLQHYVLRLDPAPDEYAERWFAPTDCPLFASSSPSDCRCVGAPGTAAYKHRYRATDPQPTRIVAGTDSSLWFAEAAAHRIGKITTMGAVSSYPADVDATTDLIAAPDGAIWFTSGTSAITKMAANGTTQAIGLSAIAGWTPTVDRLAPGSDGELWFVADGSTKIVHVTAGGALVPATVPEPQFDQLDLVAAADGAMWFTVQSADQVGVLTSAGDVKLYAIPALGSGPADPVRGPGGAIWFLETISGNLGTIHPDGRVTEVAIAPASGFGSAIVSKAASEFVFGPDGNFWITEPDEDTIVRVAPSGAATDFATPRGSHPTGLAVGPDNALWFTEAGTGKVGRIATTGAITEFSLPSFDVVRYL